MNRLRHNIIANFGGQIAANVVQLVMIPIYVRYLGVEAYGLVAFQLTLQAVFQVLDLGLSPTVNRELARYSALREAAAEARDFVRTLETGYWALGLLIGITVYAMAPFVAARWLQRSAIPEPLLIESVRLMAVVIAAQWPLTLYQGALLGIQHPGMLNLIRVLMAVVGAAGSYVVLTHTTGLVPFFRWQATIGLVHVAVLATTLWRSLPVAHHRARPRLLLVRRVWRFAAGMTAITATGLILSQVDRVILSRILSLQAFGYYALGGMLSQSLYVVISPMFASLFPKLSALVAVKDDESLRAVYRRAWHVMSALLVPAASVLALYSREVLLVWTGRPDVAVAAAPVATLLLVGAALNGLMNVPYALQLASGWTRIGVQINVALVACAVPAVLLMTRHYGQQGAAAVWPALNLAYALVVIPATHRRLARWTGHGWLAGQILVPAAVAVGVAMAFRAALPAPTSAPSAVGQVALTWIAAQTALILMAPELRKHFLRRITA